MIAKINLSFLYLLLVFSVNAQEYVLNFDGEDDYLDVGAVANNVRTIEFWYSPNTYIGPSLTGFKAMVAREIPGVSGIDEFSISFLPQNISPAGTIRFEIDGVFPEPTVTSNVNTWLEGLWYHLAAVIHPEDGMMLFINGIKQNSTFDYTEAISFSNTGTAIGCWGLIPFRHFNGKMDAVRFSTEALYVEDFEPNCPQTTVPVESTMGLFNFNEGSGNIVLDDSDNSIDGDVYGASWVEDEVCEPSGIDSELLGDDHISIRPNPSNGLFQFELNNYHEETVEFNIYNGYGCLIKSNQSIRSSLFEVDLSEMVSGIYFYTLSFGDDQISGRLIKL